MDRILLVENVIAQAVRQCHSLSSGAAGVLTADDRTADVVLRLA